MGRLAGVDGCPGGWLCIVYDPGAQAFTIALFRTAANLLAHDPKISTMAIDMPIGLVDTGRRQCDQLARNVLGARHVCVSNAPIRPALYAPSRLAASAITQAAAGRGVGSNEWALYPKIINLDVAITPAHQNWCVEIARSFNMANKWYIMRGKECDGPHSLAQLRELAETGQLDATDIIWKEGMKKWIRAKKLKGLFPSAEFGRLFRKLVLAKVEAKLAAEDQADENRAEEKKPGVAGALLGAITGFFALIASALNAATDQRRESPDHPNRSAASGYACEVVLGHCKECGSPRYNDLPVCPNCGRDRM